jgi:hypothetical protein
MHFLRAFVSCVNQGIYVRFSHLTRIRCVGLLPCVIIDQIRLIAVKILIQACQFGALYFPRDIVPQEGQFREGIVGIAMLQFPFCAL